MSSTAGGIAVVAGASSGGANASAGGGQAGTNSGATAGAAQGGAPMAAAGDSAGGTAPVAGGAAGEAGSGAAAAGTAGSGTAGSCAFLPSKALAVDAFDQGLTGQQGFAPVMAASTTTTSNGSTTAVAWDAQVGRTCPGAFRVTGTFKGYTSGAEIAIGDIRFPATSWTGVVALHAWLKVSPAGAPLQGVQLFVVSGSNAGSFIGVFDSAKFSYDSWYEMVLPLPASADFDPTQVLRVGLQIVLKTAGSSGIPATPPVVSAWLDDIWAEK